MCPNCTSSYKQKGHLVRHIKYECGVDPQFVCEICSRKFRHKSNLKAHYIIFHKIGGTLQVTSSRGKPKNMYNYYNKNKLDWNQFYYTLLK